MRRKTFTFRFDSGKYSDNLEESLKILHESNINLSGFVRKCICEKAEEIKKYKENK